MQRYFVKIKWQFFPGRKRHVLYCKTKAILASETIFCDKLSTSTHKPLIVNLKQYVIYRLYTLLYITDIFKHRLEMPSRLSGGNFAGYIRRVEGRSTKPACMLAQHHPVCCMQLLALFEQYVG